MHRVALFGPTTTAHAREPRALRSPAHFRFRRLQEVGQDACARGGCRLEELPGKVEDEEDGEQ